MRPVTSLGLLTFIHPFDVQPSFYFNKSNEHDWWDLFTFWNHPRYIFRGKTHIAFIPRIRKLIVYLTITPSDEICGNCWFIFWLLTWSSYVICIAIHVPAVSQSVGCSGLLLNTVLPFYCLRQLAVWQRPEGHALTHKHAQKHTVSPRSSWRWVSMVKLDENELRGIVCMRTFMCIFVCVCVCWRVPETVTVLSGVAALFAASADLRLSHRMGYYSDIELNLQILSCTQAPLSGIKDLYTLWHTAHTGRHTSSIYLQKHTHTCIHTTYTLSWDYLPGVGSRVCGWVCLLKNWQSWCWRGVCLCYLYSLSYLQSHNEDL